MRFIFVYTPFYTNADWILLMRRMKIMKILDFYWSSNTDWWEWKPNGMRVIKPDAPKEAQESYKHYQNRYPENRENHYKNKYLSKN